MTAATLTRPGVNTVRKENCFDALRLFAALTVVVQHAAIHLHAGFLWYSPSNGAWFPDGVAMFFILSGGMVYASAEKCHRERRPVRDYVLNRLLRIVPAIYAYLAVMIAALFALRVINSGDVTDPGLLGWVASTAFLAPVFHPAILHGFGTGVVNGSLWTIPVEVSFYILVPCLVWAAARFGFWRVIPAAFVAGAAGLAMFASLGGENTEILSAKLLGATFLPWLGYFVIGIAITRLWRGLPQHWAFALLSLAIYTACWAWRRAVDGDTSLIIALGAAVPLAYLTFWVGHHGPAVLRRGTQRIGDLSFGVYIWHMPVVNALIWWGMPSGALHGTGVVAVVLAATVFLAFVSWHAVEKPALRLKRYTSSPIAAGGRRS